MKIFIKVIFGILFLSISLVNFSQRKTETLNRGLIVVYTGDNKAYIGWRLLATDPENIAFNIYKSEGGSTPFKINSEPIVNTTDFVDINVNTFVANFYYIKPIINGVEINEGSSFCLSSNPEKKQYFRIPVQPINGKYNYDIKFCWVGDLNGDGAYDYIIDRLPMERYLDSVGGPTPKIEAYLNDGTFLWRIDAGPNVQISNGDKDMVTVFDLDADGYAEVILKTMEGTVFGDGQMIGDLDGDGKIDYRDTYIDRISNTISSSPQFISVVEGMTGKEIARAEIPHTQEYSPTPGKKFWELGVFNGRLGIGYFDGINPSILYEYENRNYDKSFNEFVTIWDYKNKSLIQKSDWVCLPNVCQSGYSQFHQIRIVDVDKDGKDEMVEGGFVLDDNGKPLWGNNEIVHGDRHQTSDIDPTRPGLETFLIQQNNPSSLGMALIDAATGKFLKKWYQSSVADVGRGEAIDLDSTNLGVELFSTMPGMYNSRGEYLGDHSIFPNSGIWWDDDLLREMMRAPDGNGFNIHICKPGKYGNLYTEGPRLYEIAKESNYLVAASYGCRPLFEGDILGDWREEIILKEQTSDGSGVVAIRIYTTTIPAKNRLYCLMQNPAYRQTTTTKGYYQAPYTDYYLGYGMGEPPIPPVQKAKLIWKGDGSFNIWNVNGFKNFYYNDSILFEFNNNDDVMFDINGIENNTVNISDTVRPSKIFIYVPINKSYVFTGNGAISGNGKFLKSGSGDIILKCFTNFSGKTIISEGTVYFDSIICNSEIYVYYYGSIGGNGKIDANIYLSKGAQIIPGHDFESGTLKFLKNLKLAHNILKFDLSDSTSWNNDFIEIYGDLFIGDNVLFQINKLKDSLSTGNYKLIKVHGQIFGDLNKIKLKGISDKKYSLYVDSGEIFLKIESSRAPTTIVWKGLIDNNWDLLTTENWITKKNNEITVFASNDSVVFDTLGCSNSDIVINQNTMIVSSMYINSNKCNYTFKGDGNIGGNADILKEGTGNLSFLTKNTYTGKTIINNGIFEVNHLDDAGLPSSIGAADTTDPSFFVLKDAKLKYNGDQNIYTNRGITINGQYDTIEITKVNKMITLKGKIVGNANLVKDGEGTLVITGNVNTYSGNTIINKGTISLGDEIANTGGLHGDIIFINGTLNMFNNSSTYTQFNSNFVINQGCYGKLIADDRCDLNGKLIGSGNFDFYVRYVRTTINGDWSSFTGKINVLTDGSADFRFANSKGLPNASLYLGDGANAYKLNGGNFIIGELSGTANSQLTGTNWYIGSKNTNSTYAGKILGDSLIKVGTGNLILTGGSNTYRGTRVVSGKLLVCNKSGRGAGNGSIIVESGAVIGGTGYIKGPIILKKGAIIEPGNEGIGTLTDSTDLTIPSEAIVSIDIRKASNLYDKLVVVGNLNFGGTLLINKIDITPFSSTDSFKIFIAKSYNGHFEKIIPEKPSDSLVWDTTSLRINGYLKLKKDTSTTKFNKHYLTYDKLFEIYPNPTSDLLNIEINNSIDSEVTIQIHNINGQLLKSLKTHEKKVIIDMKNFENSIYFIKLYYNNDVFIKKLLKTDKY